MPFCKKCKEYFPNRLKIDGKYHTINSRVFCLKCSPFKKHNTTNLVKQELDLNRKDRLCPKCKEILSIEKFYDRRGKKNNSPYCKDCMNKITRSRQLATKTKAIQYLGGHCVICGYDKYQGSMQFHHKDPTIKDFTIGYHACWCFESIKKELDKCVLLCSNCHHEVHGNVTKLP